MDPSEFEGTIERQSEVLDAGALEYLLGSTQQQFTKLVCCMLKEIY
jgi:hypothetical protein